MTALLPLLPLLLACGGSKHPVATIDVGGHAVKVELAITGPARMEGLMHRDSMPADAGMLFIYPDTEPRSFWMKDTHIPLSIAFADNSGKIVKIADMQPFDTGHTKSLYPAKYALEMNQGWFQKNGVEKGAMITGIPADLVIE